MVPFSIQSMYWPKSATWSLVATTTTSESPTYLSLQGQRDLIFVLHHRPTLQPYLPAP